MNETAAPSVSRPWRRPETMRPTHDPRPTSPAFGTRAAGTGAAPVRIRPEAMRPTHGTPALRMAFALAFVLAFAVAFEARPGIAGETPLHDAAFAGDVETVKALLAAGADPNARDVGGRTPLHGAVWPPKTAAPAVVGALLEAGADPNARDVDGRTPLHLAAGFNDNPAVVGALLDAGADPGAGPDGFTPLHAAAAKSTNPAVVETLLDAGADPSARTRGGKTPFDYAADNAALKGTAVYWRLSDGRFQ